MLKQKDVLEALIAALKEAGKRFSTFKQRLDIYTT
jgi:hypothetical protein